MRLIIKLLSLIALVFSVSSCFTTKYISSADDYWKTYEGASSHTIIKGYGVPNRVESDGNGGKIMIYERYKNYSKTDFSGGSHYSSSNTRSETDRYFTEFYIDKNDQCYQLRTTDMKGVKKFSFWKTIGCVIGTPVLLLLILAAS